MTATATAPRGKTNGTRPPAELFELPVDRIVLGDNVRADVGDVTELADSIRVHGILQPLRVEQQGLGVANGKGGLLYTLKIGHRRLAAAKLAGLTHVPAIVDVTAQSAGDRSVEQLVENLQRADLNPLEEARALRGILEADKKLTQAELAKRIGRSAPYVSNALRILETAAPVQALIADGTLSGSHAKTLAGLPKGEQEKWARSAVSHRYSVHDLEEYIARDREWEKQQRARTAEERQALKERLTKAIERLPDKAAEIRVTRWGGGATVVTALEKAGYTHVSHGEFRSQKDALGCDCQVTGIEVGYNGGLKVMAACVDQAHQEAKWKAQRTAEAQARAGEQRIREAITEHLRVALSTLDPLAARVGGSRRRRSSAPIGEPAASESSRRPGR